VNQQQEKKMEQEHYIRVFFKESKNKKINVQIVPSIRQVITHELTDARKALQSSAISRYKDIKEECLATDSILIECDSLVLYLLRMMQRNASVHFNFLHYTFLLERFIQRLIDRKFNVSLVVFECHENAWFDDNLTNIGVDKRLIGIVRKLTIQHMVDALGIRVHTFKEWWDETWRFYLQYESPYCILAISPGEHSTLLDMFIYHCLGRYLVHKHSTLNYMSIDQLEFTTNSVLTFGWKLKIEINPEVEKIDSQRSQIRGETKKIKKQRDKIKKLIRHFASLLIPVPETKQIDFLNAIPNELSQLEEMKLNRGKLALLFYHLQRLSRLEGTVLASTMTRLIVATLLLQEKLSLQDRAKMARKQCTVYSNLKQFTMKLYQHCSESIPIINDNKIVVNNAPSLFDLLDENVLNILTSDYVNNLKDGKRQIFVEPQSITIYNQLIQRLDDNSDNTVSATEEYQLWQRQTDNSVVKEQVASIPIQKLYPIRDTFVQRVLGEELVNQFAEYEYRNDEISNDNSTSFEKVVFFEKYHWHTARLLTDDFFPQTRERKQAAQKAEHQLNEYAASMKPPSARKLIEVKESHEVFGKEYHQQFLQKAEQITQSVDQLLSQHHDSLTIQKIDQILTVLSQQLESVPCEKQIAKLLFLRIINLRKKYESSDRIWKIFHACNVALKFIQQMREKYGDTAIDMEEVISQKRYIFLVLCELGFSTFAQKLVDQSSEFNYQLFVNQSVQQITDYAWFQLAHNEFDDDENTILDLQQLERKITRPLSHDLGFKPDPWQWDLIDMVNNNESVLASAPTSSGKTFIAFYCIEKVLRESNDGVVVFVCPSKALVNQTYAEVCSRYMKHLGQDMNMVGMFTADDQIHPLKCQVLVTVPACLEILLLSAQAHEWSKRLKYVIFDEIHCINEKEVGSTWEHLLLLIQCPFLALSATIGNPEEFHAWLSQLEKPNVPCVNLVRHNQRPRDLIYSVYEGDGKPGVFHEVHPLATISDVVNEQTLNSIPSMTSQQCLVAVSEGLKAENEKVREAFTTVLPANLFTDARLITRKEVIEYQKKITQTLWKLYSENGEEVKQAVQAYISKLGRSVDEAYDRMWHNGKFNFATSKYVQENIIYLVEKLNAEDLLPSILFNFSRKSCNKTVKVLGQYAFRNTGFWSIKDSDKEELEATLRKLEKQKCRTPEGVLEGLKYGIAAHHGGLPQMYLKEVERLFRKGALKIVAASGTLASGIHMPARSVVMAGDSIHLNSLIFHQCSGRSGRRGFDARGKIILFGISQARVNRLLTAKAPDILGDMSISTTLILRMMVLYRDTIEYCRARKLPQQASQQIIEDASEKLMRLLNQPLFGHGKSLPKTKQLVQHHFRFSIEFLLRQEYIDLDGKILQFTGATTHLFYLEPFNFLFMYFLRKGLFHQLLKLGDQGEQIIFLVLCHLLGRLPIIGNYKAEKKLPDLPVSFMKGIEEFNKLLSSTFGSYIRIYAKQNADSEDTQIMDQILPLSKIYYWNKKTPNEVYNTLNVPVENETSACSVFSLLSGVCSDQDYNIPALVNHLRQDIYVEPNSIPFAKSETALNAYAYLLMYDPNVLNLVNLMEKSELDAIELEQNLRQFDGDLRKLMVSMEQLSIGDERVRDPFVTAIVRLSTRFTAKVRACMQDQQLRAPDRRSEQQYQRRRPPMSKQPRTNYENRQQHQQQHEPKQQKQQHQHQHQKQKQKQPQVSQTQQKVVNVINPKTGKTSVITVNNNNGDQPRVTKLKQEKPKTTSNNNNQQQQQQPQDQNQQQKKKRTRARKVYKPQHQNQQSQSSSDSQQQME
jgi:superfamily II DNA/RNA helicase